VDTRNAFDAAEREVLAAGPACRRWSGFLGAVPQKKDAMDALRGCSGRTSSMFWRQVPAWLPNTALRVCRRAGGTISL